MKNLPTRTAAGFVLLRERTPGDVTYLLLENARHGGIGFPKGHSDPGESALDTARRETEEETGLTDLEIHEAFRRTLVYEVHNRGKAYRKRVDYFLARVRHGEAELSKEHREGAWCTWPEAAARIQHQVLREVLRDGARWWKDPALFDTPRVAFEEARSFLEDQPHVTPHLIAHLVSAARTAGQLADALSEAGVQLDVEATRVGALLHDVGRALGEHADHPRAGLKALQATRLAAYAPSVGAIPQRE